MQLYKAVVGLSCIFVLYPVIHRKQQNGPQEERREKNIQLNGSIGFFTLTAAVYFTWF